MPARPDGAEDSLSGRPGRNLAALWVFGAIGLMIAAGAAVVWLGTDPAETAAPEPTGNPLVDRGRAVFLDRCATCHGKTGAGDGPISRGLPGPPVGNLTAKPWKHGETARDVLRVVRKGVPGTQMQGWADAIADDDVTAVAAFVFVLGRRPIPAPVEFK